MSLLSTPAILLRSFPYSETSTVLRFYTRTLGVTGVMARGARSRQSRGQGALSTFTEGTLTLYVKGTRDLQTLKDFAPTRSRPGLARDVRMFAAASVLAEVVLRHAGQDPNALLYDRVSHALDRMSTPEGLDSVTELLSGLWGLVDALGYRPELEGCVVCGRPLEAEEVGRFDYSAGGIGCGDCAGEGGGPRVGPVARAQLTALLEGQVPEDLNRPRAHTKLVRDFVTYHVSDGRPLQSFDVFFDLLPTSDDA